MLLGLMVGMLAGTTGCCLFHYKVCDPEHCCDVSCGPTCGPACGGCAVPCEPACQPACEPACETSCEPCCDPCAAYGPPCGPPCAHPCKSPFAWIWCLFHTPAWCGPSCGEKYCGDYCSDPPDCCDPCDRCGNFTGFGADGCGQGGGSYGCGQGCGGGCDQGCGPYGCASRGVAQPRVIAAAPRVAQPRRATVK